MTLKPRNKFHKGSSLLEMIIANSLLFGLLVITLFPINNTLGNSKNTTSHKLISPQTTQVSQPSQTSQVSKKSPAALLAGIKINMAGERAFVNNSKTGLNDNEAWIIPISLKTFRDSPCFGETDLDNRIYCYLRTYPASVPTFTAIGQKKIAPVEPIHARPDSIGELWDTMGFASKQTPAKAFDNWILLGSDGNAVSANTLIDSTTGDVKKVREHDPRNRNKVTVRVQVALNNGGKTQAVYQSMPEA